MKYKLYYGDILLPSLLQNYTTFNKLDKCYYAFSGDTHDIIFKDDGKIRYNNINHKIKILWYERSFFYWKYYVIALENNKIYVIKNETNQSHDNLKEFKRIIDDANVEVDECVSFDSIIF